MWKRATWHECATELDQVCQAFRDAYWGRSHGSGWPRHPADEARMVETSKEGVTLLRALALAVRSEQDFAMVPNDVAVIGALKTEGAITSSDATEVKRRRGYAAMLSIGGYVPINLRQALNKIAHANPQLSDYYVGPMEAGIGGRSGEFESIEIAHDLLLYGANKRQAWFAAISLLQLVKVVRALPDAAIVAPSCLQE